MLVAERSQHFKNKRIIITGGSGFIGANLSRNLVNQGADVYSFVRKTSNLWRLKSIERNLQLVEMDLQNPVAVEQVIEDIRPNYLFHLAIPPHSELLGPESLSDQIKVATNMLKNIMHAVTDKPDFMCMVHACSSALYQWSEDHYKLSEETPISPGTLRGQLKLSERNLCLQYFRKLRTPVKLARIFRAYGPWENQEKLIGKALSASRSGVPLSVGNDLYKRDYIYIDDLIEGMMDLAIKPQTNGVEINFGSGKDFSASKIVSLLEGILGVEIPRSPKPYKKNYFDQGKYVADYSRASQLLQWQPRTTIEKGLRLTTEWYKNYHQWT